MRPSDWLRRIEDALARRLRPGRDADPHQRHLDELRARGVRIGRGCWILSSGFSTEPYLIQIGDRVGISSGVQFVTHEGGAWLLRDRHPNLQVLGRIRVGDDSLLGMDAVILPGTTIGARCIVGAGAVVKGTVRDGMVVVGNPARVVKTTEEHLSSLVTSPNRIDVWHLDAAERERRIKAHFGIDTPPATQSSRVSRPRAPLR
jgi:carbonic anhydrase/acetyltransferase-like protein (isoleucine patch superfamily)